MGVESFRFSRMYNVRLPIFHKSIIYLSPQIILTINYASKHRSRVLVPTTQICDAV